MLYDLNIQAQTPDSAKTFIQNLSKTVQDNVVISFLNHEENIAIENSLKEFGEFFGITVLPAVGIKTSDGVHAAILEPKKSANEYIKHVREVRISRLLFIMENLLKIGASVDPMSMCHDRGLSLDEMYKLQTADLVSEIMCNGHCTSVAEAQDIYDNCTLPHPKRKTFVELISSLKGERVFIVSPENHPDLEYTEGMMKALSGFIIDYDSKYADDVLNIAHEYQLECFNGSGSVV
ncbi:MAG: hypothetical protein KAS32_20875 [Candidatus Peribacteraceae bacterium]|nr:hypothetical protein [Candidatus Peribacteraceae bacterium]